MLDGKKVRIGFENNTKLDPFSESEEIRKQLEDMSQIPDKDNSENKKSVQSEFSLNLTL